MKNKTLGMTLFAISFLLASCGNPSDNGNSGPVEPTNLTTKTAIDESIAALKLEQAAFVKDMPKQFYYKSVQTSGTFIWNHEIKYSEENNCFQNIVWTNSGGSIGIQADFRMKLVGDKLIANVIEPGGERTDVIENATHETFMDVCANNPTNFGKAHLIAYKWLHSIPLEQLQNNASDFESKKPTLKDNNEFTVESYTSAFTTLGKGQITNNLSYNINFNVPENPTEEVIKSKEVTSEIIFANHVLISSTLDDKTEKIKNSNETVVNNRITTKEITFDEQDVEVSTEGKRDSVLITNDGDYYLNKYLDQFSNIVAW